MKQCWSLCDRKMPCSTYQTHDDSEVRTSSCSIRSSSKEADIERTWWQDCKAYYRTNSSTVLQRLQSAHKKHQVFLADRAAEIRENSSVDRRRHVNGIENPANIGTGGVPIEGLKKHGWLKGPAWLQTDEEKWPKPWCQVNEVEAEQATITVATETELDQLIDWRQYWNFNRFRKFTAHCMRFKTKQKGASKQTKCIKQNEYRF